MPVRVILEFDDEADADQFIENVRYRQAVLTYDPDALGGVSGDYRQHYPKLIERRETLY